MINFMVANWKGKSGSLRLEKLLRAQIHNSLDLGWTAENLVIISNERFSYMGIQTIQADLNEFCFTGSKMFGLKWYFDNMDKGQMVWSHDLDAWQNIVFEEPEFTGDVGIAQYSNTKFNGGSIFWKPSSKDLINTIVNILEIENAPREEPTLNKFLKAKSVKSRVSVLNNTYNVGCSGYVVRYNKSIKPVHVCHFHPDNRIAWETHALDRNELGIIGITKRLEKLIRMYYTNLAYEVVTKNIKKKDENFEIESF